MKNSAFTDSPSQPEKESDDKSSHSKRKKGGDKSPHSKALRLWLAAPDWLFRAAGAAVWGAILVVRAMDYRGGFWTVGPVYYNPATEFAFRVPWTRLLTDLTLVIIVLGFLLRKPPRQRARRISSIVLGLVGGYWPLLPFALDAVLQLAGTSLSDVFGLPMPGGSGFSIELLPFVIGVLLVMAGNALDVWGYATLLRSFSIVPEARELKVSGPYRLVRHPVYLGQMLAQAGVWLCFTPLHAVWIAFYLIFVALQIWRAKREDAVLEEAFGDDYRRWKKETFWFS